MDLASAVVVYKLRFICHSIRLSIFMVSFTYRGSLRIARLEEIASLWKCLDAVCIVTRILFDITEI
jgi:hypothetical protein